MWLVVSFLAALAASAAYFLLPIAKRKQYKLGFLTLMLWGMAIMVFIDHSIAYINGEEFLSLTTGGLIGSSVLLGIAMLIPIFAIWAVAAFTPLGKRITA